VYQANEYAQISEHVALGVLWTIDHCTRPQGDTAGKLRSLLE
jgi:hypothetical protein